MSDDVSAVIDRRYSIVMRRYPRINQVGCPSSVLSCTAWGFSCLANYSASGELLPRLFTLACTLLPKNRRCLFCDTLRHRSFSTAAPTSFTRHAAVWCSDFPPASPANARLASDHLPSANNLSQCVTKKTLKSGRARECSAISGAGSKRRRHRHKENRDHYERDK